MDDFCARYGAAREAERVALRAEGEALFKQVTDESARKRLRDCLDSR